jgi:hypothetical protein
MRNPNIAALLSPARLCAARTAREKQFVARLHLLSPILFFHALAGELARVTAIVGLQVRCEIFSISATRSPMMTQGAMVLPVVTRGMIEPSAMRRFSIP